MAGVFLWYSTNSDEDWKAIKSEWVNGNGVNIMKKNVF